MQIEYGPQTSTLINEKCSLLRLLWEGKSNLFCLAKGQMVQTSVHWVEKEGNTFCKTDILLKDGWPNLKCHKIDMSLVETEEEKIDLKDLWMERWSNRECVVLEVLFCSRYKPLWTSPTPIVF